MSPHHIVIKTQIIQKKKRIQRAAKEKDQVIHKGIPFRIPTDFSMVTMKARMSWKDILAPLREQRYQHRLVYPAKLSITMQG